MDTTTLIFGTCAKCGCGVSGSGVHVLRRKVLESAFPGCLPTITLGPETDLYHPACCPVDDVDSRRP